MYIILGDNRNEHDVSRLSLVKWPDGTALSETTSFFVGIMYFLST